MPFSIASAARAVLEERIAQSPVSNPVVAFARVATEFQSDLELKRLLASPESDESAVRDKFLSLNPDLSDLNWRWAPAVYPRDEFPDEFLYEMDGITIVLPGQMRERLMNRTLDVDENGFVFRGAGADPF
jgi:hypothetical protein